jgi:hypothetical protein
MSVSRLTHQSYPLCFVLEDTSEIVEAESKVRDVGPELDLPELGDEPLPPQRARKVDESNLITAFWKLMISFVLFQFMGFKNDRKAIKSESEKTDVLLPGKKEEVREAE